MNSMISYYKNSAKYLAINVYKKFFFYVFCYEVIFFFDIFENKNEFFVMFEVSRFFIQNHAF